MDISKKQLSDTKVELTITADQAIIESSKTAVLRQFAKKAKIAGFRPGKAPLEVVEKNIDQNALATEFLDEIVNQLYVKAVVQESLRPVAQPAVSITKFVPYTELEIKVEVDVVGDVKLPDYTKIKKTKPTVAVEDEDVTEVIENLRTRMAEKQDVDRAAKDGDQVWIDFVGVDAKTKEPVDGADGKDYPLVIGSNTFIPGFEPAMVGLKAKDEKTFEVTFPEDYGVQALQKKKVSFTVTVNKVQEVVKPEINDEFAKKSGPFESLDKLKDDIKKQLFAEKQTQADRQLENELVEEIATKAKVVLPDVLIEEQLDRMDEEERQNLSYRGQTWEEHLKAEGITDEEHRIRNREQAEMRVKTGLVLAEIADKENIQVADDELAIRLQILKGQYGSDSAMLAELDKPENKRDIANRIKTEKTVSKLVSYATKN